MFYIEFEQFKKYDVDTKSTLGNQRLPVISKRVIMCEIFN